MKNICVSVLYVLLCVFLLGNLASATTVPPSQTEIELTHLTYQIPLWKSVSHNGCAEKCTAVWAMEAFAKANVIPQEVADEATKRFANPQAFPKEETIMTCHGDIVAATFVTEGVPGIIARIKAGFAGCTTGYGWTLADADGNLYQVYRVVECGNYTVRKLGVPGEVSEGATFSDFIAGGSSLRLISSFTNPGSGVGTASLGNIATPSFTGGIVTGGLPPSGGNSGGGGVPGGGGGGGTNPPPIYPPSPVDLPSPIESLIFGLMILLGLGLKSRRRIKSAI